VKRCIHAVVETEACVFADPVFGCETPVKHDAAVKLHYCQRCWPEKTWPPSRMVITCRSAANCHCRQEITPYTQINSRATVAGCNIRPYDNARNNL